MGSIKNNTQPETKDHDLTEAEFNYVMNVNQAKQANMQEYNRVISAFLNYVAKSRLGYAEDQDLQFELDFTDTDHRLKVTPLVKE